LALPMAALVQVLQQREWLQELGQVPEQALALPPLRQQVQRAPAGSGGQQAWALLRPVPG